MENSKEMEFLRIGDSSTMHSTHKRLSFRVISIVNHSSMVENDAVDESPLENSSS
jgi:hypothetical protein